MLKTAAQLCVLLVVAFVQGTTRGDEPSFPYRATVQEDGAAVYAGPGAQYYLTAELPVGTVVQVHQETPGGYCAVRPPEGSFSWLPASAARFVEDGVAEVIRSQAPSRVGSLLHARRDAVHVRLEQGERVRVLSETEIDNVRWLQIAPPAGEFRWIERSLLKRGASEPAPDAADAQTDSGWVQTINHTEGDPSEPSPPAATVTNAKPLEAPAATKAPAPLPPLTGDFAHKMNTLEIALARQVAELPTLWRLEPIEQQAATLLAEAKAENERQAVRSFAARVDRFAKIANRYKATRGAAPATMLARASAPAGTTPPTVTPAPPAAATAAAAGFDAVGVLRPVVSKRPGAPQFALVDERGQIVSFVTAPTGMNLTPMVGTQVGVQGKKGYMPEYQRQHLTAGRVSPMGTTLR